MRSVSWFEPQLKPACVRLALAVMVIAISSGAGASNACAAAAAKAVAPAAGSNAHRAKAAAARTGPPSVRHTLPFISDDYARALAEAKARKVPIFVESWAPW